MQSRWALLLLGLFMVAGRSAPTLLLEPLGERAHFRYQTSEPALLTRSTADLSPGRNEANAPMRRLALPDKDGEFVDCRLADNTIYFYRLEAAGWCSTTHRVVTPDRALPPLSNPDILIDKVNYCLEVRDHGLPVKCYPFSMGPRPGRKVCLDRASTPEGRYRISRVQPETDFFCAYDLNYPNAIDKLRYQFYRRHGLLPEGSRPIGGDIQIHGQGDPPEADWSLASNWTWGCVALRNEDIAELMAEPALGKGTRVTIVGLELTREDLVAIDRADRQALTRALRRVFGPSARCDAETLGRYQMKQKLPITCQPDARTQRALGVLSP